MVLSGLLAPATILASEYAVLRSGSRITAQRIERVADRYSLTTATGTIELSAADVVAIEKDDFVTSPEPPPVVQSVQNAPKVARPIAKLIEESARRNGLPAAFVRSVAKAESGFNPAAVSSAGAIGVMQLMPATAAAMNADPEDPEQNVEAGTRYLRELLLKYDGDAVKALAAYNAGPGAVDKYNGVPPYRETITYVDRVIQDYKKATR